MQADSVCEAAGLAACNPLPRLQAMLELQRQAFLAEVPVSLQTRRDRLERGMSMILTHRERLLAAVMEDFPVRGAEWTTLAELFAPLQVYKGAIRNVGRWMRPQRRGSPPPFNLFGARSEIQYQPLGVVGVMAAWNAPLNLILVPLATVLAAGNRALLCPSDLMPATAASLEQAVRDYFDPAEVAVARGGLEVSKAFSQLAFDHLLFTGSPQVGSVVMRAASENLVPVTLELGGKCPVVVAPDADLADCARRLVAAKNYNGGQACLAPDHLFVPRGRLEDFVREMRAAAEEQCPGGARNAQHSGIVNHRHYQRLGGIIDEAAGLGTRIEVLTADAQDQAAVRDDQHRRFALHLLIDAPAQSRAGRDELFGPVLLVSTYEDVAEACARIRSAPKPLGLYVFSRNSAMRQYVLDRTFSGGATLNDALFHYSVPDLPFGGVGRSGMGAYGFGLEGFRCFSHARAVYRQAGPRALMRVMQPPYGRLYDLVVRGSLERMARKARAPRAPTSPSTIR